MEQQQQRETNVLATLTEQQIAQLTPAQIAALAAERTTVVIEAAEVSDSDIAKQLFEPIVPPSSSSSMEGKRDGTSGVLNTHQMNAFAETVKAYGKGRGIHSAWVMGNASAHDHSVFPTGHVINFKPGAKVDTITLTPESFECLVLCKIIPDKDQKLTDDFFRTPEKLQALNDAVPQYSDAPIGLAHRTDDNFDDDHWIAELGDNGSIAVLSKRRGARATDYFVAAKCGAPVYGAQLIASIDERKGNATTDTTTWGDFVDSKEVKYWKNAAKRNACRLAQKTAEKLRVAIDTGVEDATYCPDPNQAGRVTASPTYMQYVSSIASSVINNASGTRVVSQYSQCTPAGRGHGNYHIVAVSPFSGFVGVKLQPGFVPLGGALPSTTGRAISSAAIDMNTVEKDDAEAIASQYTWEGKSTAAAAAANVINDRVHPEAYRAFDGAFLRDNFVSQGWQKDMARESFDTVIMKVPSRKSRPVTTTTK